MDTLPRGWGNPVTMWAPISPTHSIVVAYAAWTRREAIAKLVEAEPNDWPTLRSHGWRVVKVRITCVSPTPNSEES